MQRFKLIKRLLGLVKSFKTVIILAVINGIIGNLCSIIISTIASFTLIKFLGYPISLSYVTLFALMIFLGCFRGVLRYFEQYSNHYIAFKILGHIRHIIFEKLRILGVAKIETKEKGALTNQITSDVETLEVFYAHTISPCLIALFVNGGLFLYISLFINLYLGLIILAFYLIVGVILPVIFYRVNQKQGLEYRNELAAFNAYYLDSIAGRKDIRYTNSASSFINEIKAKTSDLHHFTRRNIKLVANTRGIVNAFIILGSIVILMVSSILIQNNLINPLLVIVALITYLSSFGPVNALAALPSNLNQTFASAKRLFAILDEKPLVKENKNDNTFDFEKLECNNVSFAYDNRLILNNLSLTVNKQEFIGIVGPSGIGKSTLLKLIMNFYPYQGEIKFNGIELKDIDHNSLYQNIPMFSQHTYLFNDTIRNNLLIANNNATDDEIKEALRKVSLLDFVNNLEKGLDTVIKEDSTNISLGEKQRLGLARVFLRKPKLLLLDEPTSNIDSLNELLILKSLKDHKNEMTIIMISHKKSTLSIADKIYTFKDGMLSD